MGNEDRYHMTIHIQLDDVTRALIAKHGHVVSFAEP